MNMVWFLLVFAMGNSPVETNGIAYPDLPACQEAFAQFKPDFNASAGQIGAVCVQGYVKKNPGRS